MKSKNKLRMLVNYLFTTLIYLNTLKGTGIKGAVWSNQTQDQIVKQSPCTNTTKEVDIQIKRECLDAQVESLRQFFADPQVFHDQAVAKKANCAESDAYFQLAVILNQNLNYNKRQVTDFGRSDCYKCLNTSLCVFSESSELKTGDFYSLTELFMVLTDHNDFLLGYFKSFFENDEQIQEHARYSYFDALRSNPLPKAVCFYNPNKSANIQEEHMLVINLAETQTDSEFLYLRLPKTTIKKNFVPLTIKRKSLSFFKRKIINFLYLIYFARSKRNFDYLRMLALIDLIFLYLENDLLNLINFVIVYCYRLQRYTNLDISSRNNQDVHNLFLNYDSFTNVDLFESTLVSVLWWKNQNYRFTTLHESFVCLYHKILIQFFVYNADAQVALKELAVYQKFTFRCYVSFYGTDFFN